MLLPEHRDRRAEVQSAARQADPPLVAVLARRRVLDRAGRWRRGKALGASALCVQRTAPMTYTVWKLGEMVGNFATRDGALAYVRSHVGGYDDYEITDESDE
jgi:hypothetical protein